MQSLCMFLNFLFAPIIIVRLKGIAPNYLARVFKQESGDAGSVGVGMLAPTTHVPVGNQLAKLH